MHAYSLTKRCSRRYGEDSATTSSKQMDVFRRKLEMLAPKVNTDVQARIAEARLQGQREAAEVRDR